jgi:hypothetical protein
LKTLQSAADRDSLAAESLQSSFFFFFFFFFFLLALRQVLLFTTTRLPEPHGVPRVFRTEKASEPPPTGTPQPLRVHAT